MTAYAAISVFSSPIYFLLQKHCRNNKDGGRHQFKGAKIQNCPQTIANGGQNLCFPKEGHKIEKPCDRQEYPSGNVPGHTHKAYRRQDEKKVQDKKDEIVPEAVPDGIVLLTADVPRADYKGYKLAQQQVHKKQRHNDKRAPLLAGRAEQRIPVNPEIVSHKAERKRCHEGAAVAQPRDGDAVLDVFAAVRTAQAEKQMGEKADDVKNGEYHYPHGDADKYSVGQDLAPGKARLERLRCRWQQKRAGF